MQGTSDLSLSDNLLPLYFPGMAHLGCPDSYQHIVTVSESTWRGLDTWSHSNGNCACTAPPVGGKGEKKPKSIKSPVLFMSRCLWSKQQYILITGSQYVNSSEQFCLVKRLCLVNKSSVWLNRSNHIAQLVPCKSQMLIFVSMLPSLVIVLCCMRNLMIIVLQLLEKNTTPINLA